MLKYKNLTPEEFKQNIKNSLDVVVLDVRRDDEYKEGHLQQAIHTPDLRKTFSSLDKSKHYYLHCRVGGRSAMAAQFLAFNGFENVFNLNDKLENLDIELVK